MGVVVTLAPSLDCQAGQPVRLHSNRLTKINPIRIAFHVGGYPFLFFQDQAFQHRYLGYSVMACQAFEAALGLQADNRLESLGPS